MTDLEILKVIEQKIGGEFTEFHNDNEIDLLEFQGYKLNKNNNIIELVMNGCQLTELPKEIAQLTNLHELDCNHNQLIEFPKEIVQLTDLQRLSCYNNQLTKLPKEINQLTNLQKLDYSYNQLKEFPKEIIQLTNLHKLDCSNNQLTELPEEIAQLTSLQGLDCSDNQLIELPKEIAQLTNLKSLNCSNNQLTKFPKEIARLTNLQYLYYGNNQLTEFPEEIAQLTNLKSLNCSNSQLTKLPKEIAQLTNLQGLDCSDNQLIELPKEIARLTNLQYLYYSNNQLTEFPKEIAQLTNLKDLNCSNNQLTELPEEIAQLTSLQGLDCSDNQFTEISETIVFVKRLEYLYLRNNPLKNIPKEIYDERNCLTPLRDYLNSLKAETKELNEIKVLLVGDGGAGKTSLQRLLTKEKFNPQESQTHGINIKHLKIIADGTPITYRLWDFGGQEIMHATHQFFLSRRSIYIVLLNAREEPNPEYWLNHIKSFGGNSPVIVVINKIDENPAYQVNEKHLKTKYPNIIDFFRVSCCENKGIAEVKNSLRNIVRTIDDLNVKWAVSWFQVKEHLENMTEHFISYDGFTDLCKHNGVYEPSTQTTLVEYLNDLGIILHFKDLALLDTHVLNPEWVTYAVYKIINARKLAENYGILTPLQIREILHTEQEERFTYPSSQLNYIIELMKKFELCFKLANGAILIPDLLAVQEPDFDFDTTDVLNIVVSYDFLPKSILPRLMVNLHNDIIDNFYWRTGFVIKDDTLKTSAVIRADYDAKEISIVINGEQKRDYLSIILFIIRKISQSFKGLNDKVNIPLENNAKVSYEHLLLLESKGMNEYLPDGSDEVIDVQKTLGLVRSNNSTEEQILVLLEKLVADKDDEKDVLQKANEILFLKPNWCGVGLNVNAIVSMFLQRRKEKLG